MDFAPFTRSHPKICYRCSGPASRANCSRKRRPRCEKNLGKYRTCADRQRYLESRRHRRRDTRSLWKNFAVALERRRASCPSVIRRNAMTLLARLVVCSVALTCIGSMLSRAESVTGSSRTVEVADSVSLPVIEAGKPDAQSVLVFIPGWSTSADIWKRQIESFAKACRVIAFDPRSQGESTKTTSGNTPETRAQDLHALLERLGVQRPVLIGWSQA